MPNHFRDYKAVSSWKRVIALLIQKEPRNEAEMRRRALKQGGGIAETDDIEGRDHIRDPEIGPENNGDVEDIGRGDEVDGGFRDERRACVAEDHLDNHYPLVSPASPVEASSGVPDDVTTGERSSIEWGEVVVIFVKLEPALGW